MKNDIDAYRPTVLVVDIDEEVISLFRDTLKKRNYKFFSSNEYDHAKDFLDVKKLDLLIVDLYLGNGEQKGLMLATEAKEIDRNTQVIIITDKPDLDSVQEAVEIDVYDYLKKPIQIAGITRSSTRAIEKRLLLDERDDLKRYVDEIHSKLRASEERYLKFTQEFKQGRFEVEEKLEASKTELKKAVEHIKPSGVNKNAE